MPPVKQWRSVEELAQDPEFLAQAIAEFPSLTEAFSTPIGRRNAIRFMAASFAIAGLGGCNAGSPSGTFTPAVRSPENIIPALPNFYATAHLLNGYASGIVVRHFMGRPVKV